MLVSILLEQNALVVQIIQDCRNNLQGIVFRYGRGGNNGTVPFAIGKGRRGKTATEKYDAEKFEWMVPDQNTPLYLQMGGTTSIHSKSGQYLEMDKFLYQQPTYCFTAATI